MYAHNGVARTLNLCRVGLWYCVVTLVSRSPFVNHNCTLRNKCVQRLEHEILLHPSPRNDNKQHKYKCRNTLLQFWMCNSTFFMCRSSETTLPVCAMCGMRVPIHLTSHHAYNHRRIDIFNTERIIFWPVWALILRRKCSTSQTWEIPLPTPSPKQLVVAIFGRTNCHCGDGRETLNN